jgi:hypothetical protein
MKKLCSDTRLRELSANATDGQLASYYAALETGNLEEWQYTVTFYKCSKCGDTLTVVEN